MDSNKIAKGSYENPYNWEEIPRDKYGKVLPKIGSYFTYNGKIIEFREIRGHQFNTIGWFYADENGRSIIGPNGFSGMRTLDKFLKDWMRCSDSRRKLYTVEYFSDVGRDLQLGTHYEPEKLFYGYKFRTINCERMAILDVLTNSGSTTMTWEEVKKTRPDGYIKGWVKY